MKAGIGRILPGWLIITVGTVLLAGSAVPASISGQKISTTESPPPKSAPRYAGPSLTILSLPPTSAAPTTTTTIPARNAPRGSQCENSYGRLAECGKGHWDPPIVNQPASLTVSIDPPEPTAGDLVTFTFHWSDADADLPNFYFCDGRDCSEVRAARSCEFNPTGPWTPPPPKGADQYIKRTAIYTEPGTYHWYADVITESSTYDAWAQANPNAACIFPDPYESGVQLEEPPVTVAPSSTTSSSSTTTTPTTSTTSTTTTTRPEGLQHHQPSTGP